jgi:hypothetical protein
MDVFDGLRLWCNQNAGFTAFLLFLAALILGWASGIFRVLIRRPKFVISVLPGPTMCCTFETRRLDDGRAVLRTAISLYLKIRNVGSAPSSIDRVRIGYHNYSRRFTPFWFWLDQVVALEDFMVAIGENVKVYPFLHQVGQTLPIPPDAYLPVGASATGIAYFEQEDSWGTWRPRVRGGMVRMRVSVTDGFGRCHRTTLTVPCRQLDEARKFNKQFGMTIGSLRPDAAAGDGSPN